MSELNTIGLIIRSDPSYISASLDLVYSHLKHHGVNILLDTSCEGTLSHYDGSYVTLDKFADCDAAIVIGGDGTLLHAARALVDYDVPIIGINMGRLGFLVDISPGEANKKISEILDGHYDSEERFLLHTEIKSTDTNKTHKTYLAANDVIITNYQQQRMIELQTYIDGHYINDERADGLIVSTPTGSTAYALSSGGPIIHPALNVITLVPICPHSLNHRPLLIDANNQVEIFLDKDFNSEAQVSFDSQSSQVIQPGDCIRLTRYTKTIRLLHPRDYDYFAILRAKLNWGKTFPNNRELT